MTSREIIRRVIEFDSPPRIGLTLPEPYENDLLICGISPAKDFVSPVHETQGSELRRWEDEWGIVWASLTDYDKGEVMEAAITDWSQLDSYRPPDLGDEARYAEMSRAFADDTDGKYRVGGLPGFVFSVARKIRKLDNYLCDLVLERDNVERLHAMIRPQISASIERIAEAGADAVMFWEDWGTQNQLMISPDMWREIFKPDFAAFCKLSHDLGMSVFMHSCGKMTDIIGDLIEVGIDCLQFDQPRLHGIDALAEFAGKVTFWCPVDIQTTLQTRDAGKIRADAELMIERLGRGGGFIGGYYNGNEAIGLTPDVQDHACKAFTEFAGY